MTYRYRCEKCGATLTLRQDVEPSAVYHDCPKLPAHKSRRLVAA